jgi:signal peptidase II
MLMNGRLRSASIIIAVVVLDRISKMYIQTQFSPWDVVRVIPGFFNIVHSENPGAAFGMLADSTLPWRGLLLIGVSVCVMSIIGVLLWRPPQPASVENALMRLGLALVFGGALGNLWDRVLRGTVTDFVQVFFGRYEFPSFNVADSAITIGAALLLVDLWQSRNMHKGIEPGAI